MRGAVLAVAALVTVLALAGCSERPSQAQEEGSSSSVTLTFENGQAPPPERVEVGVGEEIEVVVKSDTEGSLHVHSDPEQEFDFSSGTTTLMLTIDELGWSRWSRTSSRRPSCSSKSAEGPRFVDDRTTLAHGLGGPADLPLPPELAIAGAVAALVVSFTILSVAWRKPRYDGATSGRTAPAGLARVVDSRGFSVAARAVGIVLFLYVAVASVFGKDLLTNPVFGIFYVWWWVGLVPASVLLGPVWRAISPVRTINAWSPG